MLLAGQFAGSTIVAAELKTDGVNATAYAAKVPAGLRIAVFNKEENGAASGWMPILHFPESM